MNKDKESRFPFDVAFVIIPLLTLTTKASRQKRGTAMHKRLINECCEDLARRATAITASCLREEEQREAFIEFVAAFQEVLVNYEKKRERMLARLGRPEEVAE